MEHHGQCAREGPPSPARPWLQVALVLAIAVAGVVQYLTSDAHNLHDPDHGLQQFDLFYLDQPAPLADQLGLQPGDPTLLVICQDCRGPDVDATVVVSNDPDVARAYALLTEGGRIGPGYALITGDLRVVYRTFDPNPAAHLSEIGILLEAVR